jgi:hypothetical protein
LATASTFIGHHFIFIRPKKFITQKNEFWAKNGLKTVIFRVKFIIAKLEKMTNKKVCWGMGQ